MVVYNVWYGVEGVLFSQVELSCVIYFNLVMSNISSGAANNQRKDEFLFIQALIFVLPVQELNFYRRDVSPLCFSVNRHCVHPLLTGLPHDETAFFVLKNSQSH